MFGHWVILQVTATWWSVTHGRVCHTGPAASSCPAEAVPLRGSWPYGSSGSATILSQALSMQVPPGPLPGAAGLHISPAQPFALKALSLPCPVGGFDVLLSISVLAPVAGAHQRLTHQVLVCACWFEVWSWFGSSRCQTVCTENLWKQSLSVRKLKWIMKQPYSHYCS